MTCYSLERVGFAYGDHDALHDISLRIECGDAVSILGANGSGKSTLLKIMAGLIFPKAGRIETALGPLTEKRLEEPSFGGEFRRKIGYLFQDSDVQLFSASVFEEIAFAPRQILPAKDATQAVETIMDSLRISHLANRPPYRVSGGEKKKVALASILVYDPSILLLDEPTNALDPRSRRELAALLRELAGRGRTLVLATQELALAADLTDRCYILLDGKIAASGPTKELLKDTKTLVQCNLL